VRVEQNHNRNLKHGGFFNRIYIRFQSYVHGISSTHVMLKAGVNVFNMIDSLFGMTDL